MPFLRRCLVALVLAPILQAAHAGPSLYIPTQIDADHATLLSILDTADGSRIGEVGIAAPLTIPAHGVVFNPSGTRIYAVSNNAVSVINTADNQIIARVDIPGAAGFMSLLLKPDGTLLYVRTSTNTQVVNTATNTVVGTTALFDANYAAVAFNPTGTRLYGVTNAGAGTSTLNVVDVATGSLLISIPVGSGNHDIAVSPNGTRVYITNAFTAAPSDFNSVSVIDTTTSTVAATIPVGTLTARIVINGAGTRVYVTSLFSEVDGNLTNAGYVSVIDTATNSVITKIPAGDQPVRMAINPSGSRLYVQSVVIGPDESVIAVIDTNCNAVIGNITQATVGGYFQELYMAPPTGAPPPPADPIHVQITGMEVTQGIQDVANHVALVSGRRTFVRVYVKSDGPMVEGVTAILSASGNIFCPLLQCPPVSAILEPLVPVNAVGTRLKVGPNPKRYNIDDSFLFELPWEWTKYHTLHLHAVVSQGPGLVPTQACRNDIDNAPLFEFGGEFHTLKIQFVRLSYRLPGTFNGITNAYQETSKAEQLRSESFIRRTYPLAELLPAPDYLLFDDVLGTAVARALPDCVGSDDANLCARNYISDQLAQLQASTGFMGDADAIYGLIPQVPNDNNGIYFTRGACCTGRVGAGPSSVADYAAHEIGHFLGRQHPTPGAEVCGHSASDPDYPYFRSWIATPFADVSTSLAGFDQGEPNLLIPRALLPTVTFSGGIVGRYDLMGYCKPDWISDYTYFHLAACLSVLHGLPGNTPSCGPAGQQRGPDTPQQGDWLTVFGRISSTHAADFIARRVDRNYSPPLAVSGTHSIQLMGAGGVKLAEYPFTPDDVADAASAGASSVPKSFGQVVPFVAGTQSIQIVDATAANAVLGQKAVSANSPVVSNVALQGLPDPATGLVTIAWNASDADGDSLTYDIFFTRDQGQTLRPLRLGVAEKSAQIDTTDLAGGSAQLRVVASDGVRSGFADTAAFTLANKPPKPSILNPGDGSTLHVGQLLNIEGGATDAQDGVIASSGLVWSVAGRSLGSGAKLSVTDLPVGINQISLTATNSAGLSATTTASVTVKASADQPGPTLTAGPAQIGWQIGLGESGVQTAELSVGNSGSGSVDFTVQSNATWLTLSAASGTAPATIILTADPAGTAAGTTRLATVTLTSTGSPSQVIQIPVTLAVGNTFVTGKIAANDAPPPPVPDFAITASTAASTVASGQSAQTTLTVSPSDGFHGSVSLSCSGLPATTTCAFAPASVDVNGAPATSALTVSTTARVAMSTNGSPYSPLAPGGAIAVGFALLFRRRRMLDVGRYFAVFALVFVGAFALHGCGGGGSSSQPSGGGGPSGGSTGTPAGTYNVTITATSGSTSHTVTYALTVS